MNKNAILTAKKISGKYRKIRSRKRERERERAKNAEPIQGEIKRPKTSSFLSSKLTRIAAKKISEKFKRLRYGR